MIAIKLESWWQGLVEKFHDKWYKKFCFHMYILNNNENFDETGD